ncbi:uncharacterized protein LOC141649440 [Silene latifolia]|uniref:uncharacterized protein LOC141649440 n=1 Tax=Silene latifolia TaxID=37657 RepID=UPI003D785442
MDDNPYGKFFRSLKEIEVAENTKIVLSTDPATDQCVHNAPTSDEVAVVWSDNTALWKGRIPCSSRGCKCCKEDTKADKRISFREYYAYKFQIRPGNLLIRGGRLFQQFIVDMYVKIENTRLDFLRLNQEAIRQDLYQGILDTLELGEISACNVGMRIVLPLSFLGGPRDMRRRVFNAKLTWLRKLIREKKLFGEVAAMINVVEFQKRGLPHAHFLIILKPGYKITSPKKFDKYVSAEIPTNENPHLKAAVLRHMMHGPCGEDFPKNVCMKIKDGKRFCEKKYPKSFRDFTTNGKDSYPLYRRRNTGETVLVRKGNMDNRSVVPYNPYLLAMFDCHLNVEVCSTINAVKYLYKYVYKGHDRILFNVTNSNASMLVDEIEKYQSGRWVSPPEAAWRIFGFKLFDTYSPVQPLPVHIPNGQTKKFWKPRDRGVMIGRVAHASPGEEEQYYLRLLLAHVRGPRSFEDLKTVNGVCCVSFQEVALKRGVMEQDNVADMCMDEVVQVEMPNALRRLFATILIFSCPNNPAEFWSKYYQSLPEDYKRQFPYEPTKILQETAAKVEQFLEGMRKTFKDFRLDHLHFDPEIRLQSRRDISDALNAPIPMVQLASRKELNVKQRAAYKAIIHQVKSAKGGAFFIDGPGGTGKTFLYGALYAKVRSMSKICLPTATSGIAASNLPTGRTTHSRFKIPLDTDESQTCNVPKQGGLACLIREASLVIWDEASMAERENIEAVNMLFQDVCSSSEIFGGKVIFFGGDFRQVLPVLPRRTQQEEVETSIVSSPIWPLLKIFKLTENIRARTDPEFSEFLLKLGNGELQTAESSLVAIPQELILEPNNDQQPEQTLIDAMFPEISQANFSPDIFNARAILTPRNEDVDSVNSVLIDRCPGKKHIYHSFDSVVDDNSNVYPAEFLNSLCPAGMTPHELTLKEDSPVILLRNLDPVVGMKPQKKMVKDLSERIGPHSIRLKVIEKTNTQISPKNKELHYQRIVFQDEEGAKIRTTLYEEYIAAYEDVIFDKMEYEICNAKIKMLPEKYRRDDEHPYQLAFGTQTIITPVEGCKPPMGPDYISITAIPRMVTTDDRYDVVDILIHVEMLREVPRADGGILALRELVVMDASTEQSLFITVWAELATREGEQLRAIVETFPVIGFTCLKR